MKLKTILVAFAIIVVAYGCQPGKKRTVSDDLVGTWKTTDANYSNSFVEFMKYRITFGAQDGSDTMYDITKVEKEREDENTLYTIYYADREGLEYRFSFYHTGADNGVIRFKNQKQIAWTKLKQ